MKEIVQEKVMAANASGEKTNENWSLQILSVLDKARPGGLTSGEIQKNLTREFNQTLALGTVITALRRLDGIGYVHFKDSYDAGEVCPRKYYITPQGTGFDKGGEQETESVAFTGALTHS